MRPSNEHMSKLEKQLTNNVHLSASLNETAHELTITISLLIKTVYTKTGETGLLVSRVPCMIKKIPEKTRSEGKLRKYVFSPFPGRRKGESMRFPLSPPSVRRSKHA
jgi:hypothetical protein